MSALSKRDRPTLRELVQGSKYEPSLEPAVEEQTKPTLFSVSDISLKTASPTRVTVGYLLKALPSGGKLQQTNRETLEMVQVGSKWLIVAPAIDTKVPVGYLARVALLQTQPRLYKLNPEMNRGEKARSNLKDIAIGVMMYVEDNEGKLLLKPKAYPEELDAYIRIRNVFTSPLDKPGTISYLLNGSLIGRRLASLRNPQNTVLFFEGKPGALNFRYDGQALVAFANGTVRFVTPEEAKHLLWK